MLARMREAIAGETRARVFWGLGITATAAFAGGLALTASVPVAMGYGGKGVVIAPAVTFTLSEAGWVVAAGAGGVLLGCALFTFALGPVAVPAWLRWSTLVAGVAAFAGAAWFPLALVVIWSLATCVWLLAANRAPAASPVTA
jgi:hypothetical protein